jgi:hypothetical protein
MKVKDTLTKLKKKAKKENPQPREQRKLENEGNLRRYRGGYSLS